MNRRALLTRLAAWLGLAHDYTRDMDDCRYCRAEIRRALRAEL